MYTIDQQQRGMRKFTNSTLTNVVLRSIAGINTIALHCIFVESWVPLRANNLTLNQRVLSTIQGWIQQSYQYWYWCQHPFIVFLFWSAKFVVHLIQREFYIEIYMQYMDDRKKKMAWDQFSQKRQSLKRCENYF